MSSWRWWRGGGLIRRLFESTDPPYGRIDLGRPESVVDACRVLPPGTRCHNVLSAKPRAGFPPIFTWRTADALVSDAFAHNSAPVLKKIGLRRGERGEREREGTGDLARDAKC